MKIYVVISYEQDDIAESVMAFTDKDRAEDFCDALWSKRKMDQGTSYFVQEVELKQ
jgi:hypothetical protein